MIKKKQIRKVNCSDCANLIKKEKLSVFAPGLSKKNPCKYGLASKGKFFFNWETSSINCKKFEPESREVIPRCKGCGFVTKQNRCLLHKFPVRQWLKGKCKHYDKNPQEIKDRQTQTYKKWNKKFNCRFSCSGDMPTSEREEKEMICSLCLDRGGDPTCPISDPKSMREFRLEIQKELCSNTRVRG